MPRCKQAMARAAPPIPPPIIAICGIVSLSGIGWLFEGIIPVPSQVVQGLEGALARVGALVLVVEFLNLSNSF